MKNLFVTLFALVCSVSVHAYDFVVDGIYYSIVSLPDLTVSVAAGDEAYQGDVVIPETITYQSRELTVVAIDGSAFKDCRTLTSIQLPKTVTTIGTSAFQNCSGLTSFDFPSDVTTINPYAFSNCRNLTSLVLPNSLKSIGAYSFYYCTNLTSVVIPNLVNSIGSCAFKGCSSVTDLTLGTAVVNIAEDAFETCRNISSITFDCKTIDTWFKKMKTLKKVVVGDHVETIERQAFFNCTGITELRISDSVKKIGASAFYGCSSLKTVSIGKGVVDFGEAPFASCSELSHITINCKYVETLFKNYSQIDTVVIGDDAEVIRAHAFSNCAGLTNVTIGDKITTLTAYSFRYCSSLTDITIGSSITSIERDALNECTSLSNIYLKCTTPPTVKSNNFTTSHFLHTKVFVPRGTLQAYQAASVWKDFWNIEEYDPDGETYIDAPSGDDTVVLHSANGITLSNAHGKSIVVYSINGMRVLNITKYQGEELPLASGTYIITVAGNAISNKISIK
jgi:hypothetical protein